MGIGIGFEQDLGNFFDSEEENSRRKFSKIFHIPNLIKNKLFLLFFFESLLKKLRQLRYSNIDIFGVIPNYRYPKYILPIDNSDIFNFLIRLSSTNLNLLSRLILYIIKYLGSVKYFIPSFYIIAGKEGCAK
jgi:hypothetical protein